MIARWGTLFTLVLLLGNFAIACGNYGRPVRTKRLPEPAATAEPSDSSEEDSDRKEKKP
jgi:hypothetical protein